MSNQEEIPFAAVLIDLLDPDHIFTPNQVLGLSHLGPAETRELASAWDQIPLDQRRSLLEDMLAFAEADALLFYDNVGTIALRDEDPLVRSTAIRLNAIEEKPEFAGSLLGILDEDPHFEVRAAAASALGRYVYLGELEEIPQSTFESVEEGLLKAYREDPQVLVRRKALEALSFSSRKVINSLIEDAFTTDDEDWQVSAVTAMGFSANPRWEPQVMDMLDADSSRLRFEAAYAAGKLDLKAARPILFNLANEEEDDGVRHAAIWALSDLGGQDVSEFLEDLLEEAETEEEEAFLEDALENLLESQLFGDMDLPLFDFEENGLDGRIGSDKNNQDY